MPGHARARCPWSDLSDRRLRLAVLWIRGAERDGVFELGPAPAVRAPKRIHAPNDCDPNDGPLCLRCSVARSLRVSAERFTRSFRVGHSVTRPARGCAAGIDAMPRDARNAGEIVGNARAARKH
jgi:hypothetical protein